MTQETERKFYMHPKISVIEEMLFSCAYMAIIICWAFTFLLLDQYSYYRPHFIRLSIYISFTILLIVNLLHIIITRLKKTVFVLTDRSVIKVSPGRAITFQFSDIVSFRYKRFIIGNGFGYIKTLKRKVYIFFTIKNLSEFIDLLQGRLRTLDRHSVFDEKEINEFKYRALLVGFTMEKTFFLIRCLIYTILSTLLLNYVIAFHIWQLPFLLAFLWILYGLFLAISNDLITRFLFMKNVLNQLKRSPESTPVCDILKIYSYTSLVTIIVYFVCGIIYKKFLAFYL
jgi:hypothetical protein